MKLLKTLYGRDIPCTRLYKGKTTAQMKKYLQEKNLPFEEDKTTIRLSNGRFWVKPLLPSKIEGVIHITPYRYIFYPTMCSDNMPSVIYGEKVSLKNMTDRGLVFTISKNVKIEYIFK